MRLSIFRLELDGTLIACHRLVELALLVQYQTKIVVIKDDIMAAVDRPHDQICGQFEATPLVGDQPQQMQGIRVAGIEREYAMVQTLCFCQTPSLMMGKSLAQNRANRTLGILRWHARSSFRSISLTASGKRVRNVASVVID